MPSPPRRKPPLATAQSPFYQQWVLTNRVAKPFQGGYGRRFHLNLTEWRILLTIADRPGISAQELADYSGLDKMTVSRVVRGLESRQWLQRRASLADGRRRDLALTDEGWRVYLEIARAAHDREARVYEALSATERATLLRLLLKLNAHVDRLDDGRADRGDGVMRVGAARVGVPDGVRSQRKP